MTTPSYMRPSLVRRTATVWGLVAPARMVVATLATLLLVMGSGCSKLVDLDGLSKNYGSTDGPADQHSDRMLPTSDSHDTSPVVDVNTNDRTPDAGDGGDGADPSDAGTDLAADAPPGDVGPPDSSDASVGTDGNSSGDATGDGGGQMCESEALNDGTLELNTAAPSVTACGYPAAGLPTYYAAVDNVTYGVANACGGCVRIHLSNVVVDAVIVDLGSARFTQDHARFGVNKAASDLLLPDGSTFVAEGVPWNYIACPAATTGMIFTLQTGSSTTYSALVIQNHRYRLQAVEYWSGSVFKPLTRTSYNSWVAQTGMGAGPFTLRLTDINGSVVLQSGIPLTVGVPFHGQSQFPLCPAP